MLSCSGVFIFYFLGSLFLFLKSVFLFSGVLGRRSSLSGSSFSTLPFHTATLPLLFLMGNNYTQQIGQLNYMAMTPEEQNITLSTTIAIYMSCDLQTSREGS